MTTLATRVKKTNKIPKWVYFGLVIGALTLIFGEPSKPAFEYKPSKEVSQAEKDAQAIQKAAVKAQKDIETAARDARLYAISMGSIAVKDSMRDPDSLQWIFKAVNLDNGALCYQFRARNGFNGMGTDAIAIHKGKMHTSAAQWNKLCGGGKNWEEY